MQAKIQKIVVLGTGGTIAGESNSADEGLSYKAAQRGIEVLLKAVAGSSQKLPPSLANVNFEVEQVAQLDSKDMDFATWRVLAQRCEFWLAQTEVVAVVITHGTDTLEETAFFLSQVLSREKPIVLTCAMRPANFKDADGPQNLRDALNVSAQVKGAGVWLVAAGEIHHSQFVQKVHPTRLNAFDSGEVGAAGKVSQDQIFWAETFNASAILPSISKQVLNAADLPKADEWPWVEIVMNHVQASFKQVDLLVNAGVQGLVVAGTGNGSIGTALKEGLLKAQRAGVRIRIASRCAQGPVLPTEGHIFKVDGGLNAVKTRVAMLLEIMSQRQSQ